MDVMIETSNPMFTPSQLLTTLISQRIRQDRVAALEVKTTAAPGVVFRAKFVTIGLTLPVMEAQVWLEPCWLFWRYWVVWT